MILRLLFCLCFISFLSETNAQVDSTESKDKSISIKVFKGTSDTLANVKTRWTILELGTSLYLHQGSFKLPNAGTQGTGANAFALLPGRSINTNLYVYQQRINLLKHRLNFMHGLGFEFHSYHFEHPTILIPEEPNLTVYQDSISYRKNKLRTSFITLPVMFNYESKPGEFEKSFRASFGAYGGILLGSSTKRKNNALGKQKERDDFNLNKFRYGLRGEMGFGPINFYVTYALNTLFQQEDFPDLNPLSIGIKIIPF